MTPNIDAHIGISAYATEFKGIGGSIRAAPEDFDVTELLSDDAVLSAGGESGYAVCVLEKRNIDTAHALLAVQKKTGARFRALGLKDASAVTRQFVCSEKRFRPPEYIDAAKFSLRRVGFAKRPLSKRDMVGNRFKIRITDPGPGLGDFAEHDRVLNFYGYQRFGSRRPVTHLVGQAMLRRDFAEAVRLILSYTSEYDSAENTKLRQSLSDADYARHLGMLPPQMDIERAVLGQMADHGDPLRALRAVSVSMRRFYVQAYQSYLFNLALSEALEAGEDLYAPVQDDVCFGRDSKIAKCAGDAGARLAVPIVGYSYYKKTRFHRHILKVLESEQIAPRDFFIKEMQEASGEGGFRQSAIHCTGYETHDDTVEFTLSRGSFATILLREIIKPQNPLIAGF